MKPAKKSFLINQNVLLTILLVVFGQQAFGQNVCDSIVIDKVEYFAFDPMMIEVSGMTTTNDCISYPSFVLFDQNGDTLATEMVNYFCLGMGNLQSHALEVLPGATLPQSPFMGTLELFSGFGSQLVCSWNMTFDLCPPDNCIQAEVYLTNLDTLQAGNVYWYVYDTAGVTMASGVITMDMVDHTHFDTLCLPPGDYQLFVSPFSDIWVDDNFVLGITTSYWFSTGINTAIAGSPDPMLLDFGFYEECFSGPNSIGDHDRPTFGLIQQEGAIQITSIDANSIGRIDLIDIQGRVHSSTESVGNTMRILTTTLSPGIYLVRNITSEQRSSVQRIFIQ